MANKGEDCVSYTSKELTIIVNIGILRLAAMINIILLSIKYSALVLSKWKFIKKSQFLL